MYRQCPGGTAFRIRTESPQVERGSSADVSVNRTSAHYKSMAKRIGDNSPSIGPTAAFEAQTLPIDHPSVRRALDKEMGAILIYVGWRVERTFLEVLQYFKGKVTRTFFGQTEGEGRSEAEMATPNPVEHNSGLIKHHSSLVPAPDSPSLPHEDMALTSAGETQSRAGDTKAGNVMLPSSDCIYVDGDDAVNPNKAEPDWLYHLFVSLGQGRVSDANIAILEDLFAERFSSDEIIEEWNLAD